MVFSARASQPSTLSMHPVWWPLESHGKSCCVARFTQGLLFVNEGKLKNCAIKVLVSAWEVLWARKWALPHTVRCLHSSPGFVSWHHFCQGAAPFQDTWKSFWEPEEKKHVQTWETKFRSVAGKTLLQERNGTLCNWEPVTPHQEKMVFSTAHVHPKEQVKEAFPPNYYFCKNAVSSKNKPGKNSVFFPKPINLKAKSCNLSRSVVVAGFISLSKQHQPPFTIVLAHHPAGTQSLTKAIFCLLLL